MALRWYLARTQPQAERFAVSELDKDGLEVFWPRIKALHRQGDHLHTPLFPGYLFVRVDLENVGWPTFRAAHRLLGWVNFGGEIASLPDDVMGALMDQVKTINGEGGLWQRFQRGQTVRVITHNLDTLAEVIEEARSPQGQAKVLMQFMGRMIQAKVPWKNLRPIETTPVDANRTPRRTRGNGRWVRGFGPNGAATT